MATIIRLARFGRKHYPTYRITVADNRRRSTGKFLEQIGHYNPHTTPPTLEVKEEMAIKWLMTGAQMSKTIQTLLFRSGTLEKFAQVKAGKSFEEATSTPQEWPTKTKKKSRKTIEKEKQKLEAVEKTQKEAQEKTEAKQEKTVKETKEKTPEKEPSQKTTE